MAVSISSPVNLFCGAGLLIAALPHAPAEKTAPVTPLSAMSEPSLSPDRREIAFVSGGDIWTVPAGGGEARLLVSHPAYDSRPLYSPDGTKLAFMSTRTGNGDIYVLTLATGRLDRVTFDDVSEQLDAWSRDGKWIYFSSGSQDVNGMNDIFRVNATGGTPMAVSADRFTQEYWSAPSPADANTIAFTGTGRTSTDWWRKGHSHIDESQIWLVHLSGESPRYEAVTKDDARDAWPMWSADAKALYYVSDKSGSENIWTASASGGGAAKAVTSFTDGRVIWPTIAYDGKAIVFERDFGIWSLDVATGKATRVPITLRGAATAPIVEHQVLAQGFQSLALSPDGKKVAFVAHGDVFAASARDGGEAARITTTPELELQLAWAPDSRRLAYVSSRDGSAHLFVYDFGTRTETKLTDGPLDDVSPAWSPDGRSIAFDRGGKELRVIDVATKQDRVVAAGQLDRPPFLSERQIAWSPDGQWIAYLNVGAGQFQNPNIASVNGGGGKPISFLSNAFGNSIAWSPDGTYLLFDSSQRTEQAVLARVDLVPRTPQFREDQFRELFAPTRPGTPVQPAPQPAPPQRDSATLRSDSARGAAKKSTRVVFDDIRRRISFLPIGVDVRTVVISPDGKTALLNAAAAGQANLYTFSLDELASGPAVARQLTSTPGFKQNAQFSPDGKEVYYLENGRLAAINVDSRAVRTIAVSADLDIDFAREKLAVFHEAWSILAGNFFEPHMNGVDWPAVEKRYEPYAAGAQSTEDLRRIMKLMVGELNASHSGVNGPSFSPQPNVGRLGLRFDRAEYEQRGKLRIVEVLNLSPAALADVTPGDYIQSVDGVRVDGSVNLDSLLLYKTNRRVEIAVSRTADGAGARTIAIRPINLATERGLVYRDWVESRRAYVAKMSGGTLGYVHMQDMGAGSLQQLYVDLDTENRDKQGVVVDIRNNNGGFVNPYAIDVFARRGYLQFTPRDFGTGGGRSVVGQRSLEKPTALVTNMHSLSDAEDFTEGYRSLKLGPVVGEPTAGWIIFTSDFGLLDGSSSVRVPFERITDAAGKDMEMHPRAVDVLVRRPVGESYTGRDSQLDAAVKALLDRAGAKQ
ncbi:MAG TPA: S41 family peptidase [Gemmatimonadaceae bacterium]|nr:S41 family peptidase [Gemmatimonadaceae bacterium]